MATATALRLSRRQALGLAAGGAAAAAGLRLTGGRFGLGSGPAAATAGPGWRSPLGDSRALAAHLLRRVAFAPSPADLDAAAGMRYTTLVDALLAQAPDAMPVPQRSTQYLAVVQAWYQQMATTAAQVPERMALFWHGLLTSDYRKAGQLPLVHQQLATLRAHALGDLRSLLLAITYDPLMGRYLDLDQSSQRSPNENFSRELMELYTLGVGNYSETDVREGARALSGIRMRFVDAAGTPAQMPRIDRSSQAAVRASYAQYDALIAQGYRFEGYLVPRAHDTGSKTYLGRTGNLGPEEVVDAILAQPACATYVAGRAITAFASPSPSPGYVDRVATAFRTARYDIRTLMRAILTDDEFTADTQYRSLVRSPAEFMVATMRVLGRPDLAPLMTTAGQGMDQVLYDPPTVAGWPVNGGWVSSSAMLARVNLVSAVLARGGALPDPQAAVRDHLDGVVGPDTARVFNASTTTADRWYAVLGGPEFQLK